MGFGILIVLASAVLFGFVMVQVFARHEALIERFCRKTAREELIEQTQDRARRLGLLSDDRKATGSFGPSMTISAKAWLLPGASFCSVYHDGERVTEVSYNPWYH